MTYRVSGMHIAEFSALDTECKTAELGPAVRYSPMSEHSEERGRRIKAQRRMKRLTQQQLADRLGVSKGLVSQWEKGQIENISHPNWMGLVNELGVDAEMLEFGPDEPRPAPGEGAGRWRKRN